VRQDFDSQSGFFSFFLFVFPLSCQAVCFNFFVSVCLQI